jgi:cell division protein FtsI (penicillin-binding protein 3)
MNPTTKKALHFAQFTPKAKAGKVKPMAEVFQSLGLKASYQPKGEYFNTVDSNNGTVYNEIAEAKGIMPNVSGMGLRDAMVLLGNAGLKSSIKGSGVVVSQSIPAGSRIGKGLMVSLILE